MAVDHNNPQSRNEEILIAAIDGTEYNKPPQSRIEELLLELKEVIEAGGGGGTSDYTQLSNLPKINDVTLTGEMTAADLSLVLAEVGKGLSTNDYSNEEKSKVANLLTAIQSILDGTDIDSFGDVEVALLDKADISDLGTAAAKNSTNAVTSGSTDLVESGAVKDAIDAAVAAAYHHAGTKTVAQLTHDLLVAANEGNVYNITDFGTTTSDFIEGIGKTIDEGSNVGICKVGNVYMFDLLSGFVDTTNFVQKSQTSGLLKNDGTVNEEIEDDVDTLTEDVGDIKSKIDDSTTYPYASSITIPDAIPANLAECNVKIEPVQDLHGYDHPWVGGAGDNKLDVSGVSEFPVDTDGYVSAANTSSDPRSWSYANSQYKLSLKSGDWKVVIEVKTGSTSISNGFRILNTSDVYIVGETNAFNAIGIRSYNFTLSADTNIGLMTKLYDGVSRIMILPQSVTSNDWQPYTNICPITGHTEASVQRDGKNLFNPLRACVIDSYFTNNILRRPNANVVINADGTFTSSETVPWCIYSKFYFKKNKTYYLSTNCIKDNALNMYLGVCDSTGKNVKLVYHGTGIRLDYDLDGYFVVYYGANWTTGTFKNMVTLEQASIADYEPFKGKTYIIALGDTIYGGTVDFDSGVMTVTHGIGSMLDLSWSAFSGSVDCFYAVVDGVKPFNVTSLCSSYKMVSSRLSETNDGEATFMAGNGNAIYVRNDSCADVTAFEATLSGATLCYELATPTTIQLTPQQIQLLKGHNTITASTGDISVTVNGVSGAIGAVQEQVNELAEEVTKVHSFTGTTSAYGVLTPSPSISVEGNFIIGAYGNGSYIVIPFTASSDNTWRFMVLQSNNIQPLAEQEATVKYVLVTKA